MPAPLVAAAIGQGLIQVLTKPYPWAVLFGFVVISKFDLGVFGEEVRETLWSFWPFVLLIILIWFALKVFEIYRRGSRDRA